MIVKFKKKKKIYFVPFFQPISNADFIVPVEIDGTVHQVSLVNNQHQTRGL